MTRTARVRDIAEQVRGVTYSKSESANSPRSGLVPVLRAGNIGADGDLRLEDLVYVPAARVALRQRLRQDDVLIASSSGSLDVVGKAARVPQDLEAGFGAFCKVLRPGGDVEPRYFAHFFQTPNYRRRISAAAAGININNLRSADLDDLEMPVPPVEEQRRIAAVLDQADDVRAKRRASLALLDSLTESIFLNMFGDLDSSWPVVPLADVVEPGTSVTYGIVQAGEEDPYGVPYIRTGDIVGGEIVVGGLRRTSPEIARKFERSRVSAGDIVMSIRATVGTTALVPESIAGANLTQGTARIAPGPQLDRRFLLAQLRSGPTQRWIQRQVKGATFREITLKRLRELPVVVPPASLQETYAARASGVEAQLARGRSSWSELDALFASLQHRAFAGAL